MKAFWAAVGVLAVIILAQFVFFTLQAGGIGHAPIISFIIVIGFGAFWMLVIYAIIEAVKGRA